MQKATLAMQPNGNEIRIEDQGAVTVLNITGDITASSLGALRQAYGDASQRGTGKLLIKIDKEAYINSGGIAALIQVLSQTRQNDQQAAITGISDHFQKIFKMVGITRLAAVFDSEDAALQSLS